MPANDFWITPWTRKAGEVLEPFDGLIVSMLVLNILVSLYFLLVSRDKVMRAMWAAFVFAP